MSIDRAPVLAQGGDMAMELYPEMAAAMQADDVDRYVALLDEDFEYVRHKSETVDEPTTPTGSRGVTSESGR